MPPKTYCLGMGWDTTLDKTVSFGSKILCFPGHEGTERRGSTFWMSLGCKLQVYSGYKLQVYCH